MFVLKIVGMMFLFIGFFKQTIDEAITACNFTFLMPKVFKKILIFKIVFGNKKGYRLTATNASITMNENTVKVIGINVFIKKLNKFFGLCFDELHAH